MPEDKWVKVLLMDEGRNLSLEICFFGYTYDMVEDYIKKNFIESGKEYAKKWTQMKYL